MQNVAQARRQAFPVLAASIATLVASLTPARIGDFRKSAVAPPSGNSVLATSAFIENQGQWDTRARYMARVPGGNLWLTDSGAVYDLYMVEESRLGKADRGVGVTTMERPLSRVRGHVVSMEFVGGNPSASHGENVQEARYNYFLGADSAKWVRNARSFEEVRSEHLYDGIEARWYFDQGQPRYDLIVAPGADPKKIAMRFRGADGVRVENGVLRIGTKLGSIEHRGLFAYQRTGGAIRQVPCSMSAEGNTVRFDLGRYDHARPVTIDPLLFGTYLGGSADDYAFALALSSADKPVVTGYTVSTNFPTTVGAYDRTYNGGAQDGFVARFNATGTNLQYCTLLGGSGTDWFQAVGLDDLGNTYLCGTSQSTDFPTTVGAFDVTANSTDTIVCKLTPDLSTLLASTRLGGTSLDFGQGLGLDSSGNVVVCGYTNSGDFPTTAGAFATTSGGSIDSFATKLDSNLANLSFSTYLGGSGLDYCSNLVVDSLDKVYVAGYTNSTNFPTTPGVIDTTGNGDFDCYLTKLNASGSGLGFSTLFGGSGMDVPNALALDPSENPLMVGQTDSTNFPTTAGVFDTSHNGGQDAFVAGISKAGSSTLFASYLGGDITDSGMSVGVDSAGNVIVSGYSNSTNYPTTPGAAYPTFIGGFGDGIVSKLDPTGASLLYSTYYGGTGTDDGYGLAVASDDHSLTCGDTNSSDFPVSEGASDASSNGGADVFVAKVDTALALMAVDLSNAVVGGYTTPMTPRLNQDAPTGGTLVSLSTDNPGKIIIPATCKVPETKRSKQVTVKTETVLAETIAHITASFGGVSITKELTLRVGGLQSLKLDASMTQSTVGAGFVNISGPAPAGGRTITLSSNSAAMSVPPNVTVPQGNTSQSFVATAGAVASNTNVTVIAKAGAMSKADTITITP